jgi:hypothetical protein
MRQALRSRHARLLKIEPRRQKMARPLFWGRFGAFLALGKGHASTHLNWPLFKTSFALWCVSPSRHTHRRENHQTGNSWILAVEFVENDRAYFLMKLASI